MRSMQNPVLNMMHRSARAVAPELLGKKNVQFVTIGQKRTKGVRTPEASIVVYVTKKERVSASDRIPETIPAISRSRVKTPIQTDVVELQSDPAAFGVMAGNVLLASDMNYGVCGLSFNKNGTGYVLTNAHVGCNIPQGGAPCTLNLLNPGSNQPLPVGPVIWSSGLVPGQVATNDAAIARADQIAVEPYQILNVAQRLSGTSHFVQGSTTYWFMWNGVEFDCAYPEPVLHPAWINVEGVNIQYDGFWILQMTRGASAPGQSGGLICRTDNGTDVIGCGLIFGGSAPNLIFAFPFDKAFDQAYSALP
jgi:hypothetical protein